MRVVRSQSLVESIVIFCEDGGIEAVSKLQINEANIAIWFRECVTLSGVHFFICSV